MRLEDLPTSTNVSDQRGMRTAGMAVAGGGGLLLLILGLVFGVDTSKINIGPPKQTSGPAPDDKYADFAGKVVGTLETVWDSEFAKPANGYPRRQYEHAKLVLFSDGVKTGGCGFAPAEVGPFYCPGDKTMYLDPTFFDELETKLKGSKAQFSQAYVIAHENGHHVQNLLGFSARVDDKRGTRQENEYSLRLELQADYLAGVWAHLAQRKFNFIEPGDVESALTSAKAIGDDRLQRNSSGFVHPEKFNHGTSRQRVLAFDAGFRSGDASMAKLDRFFTVRFDAQRGELDDSLFR